MSIPLRFSFVLLLAVVVHGQVWANPIITGSATVTEGMMAFNASDGPAANTTISYAALNIPNNNITGAGSAHPSGSFFLSSNIGGSGGGGIGVSGGLDPLILANNTGYPARAVSTIDFEQIFVIAASTDHRFGIHLEPQTLTVSADSEVGAYSQLEASLSFDGGPFSNAILYSFEAQLTQSMGMGMNPTLTQSVVNPTGAAEPIFMQSGTMAHGAAFDVFVDLGFLAEGTPLRLLYHAQTVVDSPSVSGAASTVFQEARYGDPFGPLPPLIPSPSTLPPHIQALHQVPEPGTWLLLATGLVGLLGYGYRQRRRA